MRTRQVALIAVALAVVTLMIGIVSAAVASDNASPLTHFINNLLHYGEKFSVVGDARACGLAGGNPNYEWQVAAGKLMSGSQGVISGAVGQCTNGVYDIFTNGWTPLGEFNSFTGGTTSVSGWTCGTGPCNIQAYCCPSAEPTSQASCPSGKTFETKQCTSSIVKSGVTFYWCPSPSGTLENRIPYALNSYNYCKTSTSMTCWYKSGSSCSSRSYDKSVFPNACESYTYNGAKLYSSQSACTGSSSCLVDFECASGKVCSGGSCVTCAPSWVCTSWSTCSGGSQTRTCTDSNDCGTTSGRPATSQSCTGTGEICCYWYNPWTQNEGYELQLSKDCKDNFFYHEEEADMSFCGVTPTQDCSQLGGTVCLYTQYCNIGVVNARDTVECCTGTCVTRCNNDGLCGYGETYATCPHDCNPTVTCPAGQTCGSTPDDTTTCTPDCSNKCGGARNNCGGTCDFPCSLGEESCSDGILNQDETETDCGGIICPACGSQTLVTPTKNVEVLNIELPSIPSAKWVQLTSRDPVTREYTFKATLKNNGATTATVNVEAGFYTYDYAKNTAKLFSIFPFFATINPITNCVGNEPFVRSVAVTLDAGETKDIEINMAPVNAYVTLPIGTYVLKDIKLTSFLGVYDTCCKKLPDFEGCAEGTGGYIDSKYDPVFSIPDMGATGSDEITCDGKVYGKVDWNLIPSDKIIISDDYKKCIEYTFYTPEGKVDEAATQAYKDSAGNLLYEGVEKFSLTKEKISTATNTELLASACLKDGECLEKTNYTVSCISIRSLRDDGTLTEAKSQSFFEESKAVIKSGIKGATIGTAIGLVSCGALILAVPATVGGTAPVAAVVCPLAVGAGAAVGAGVGLSFVGINQDDPLIAALNVNDDNSVGICTAEPSTTFDISGFLSKIGNVVKITGNPLWDGIIVIIAGFFILSILLNMMRSKK